MNRIEFLASLTKGFSNVLDIGTDHGLVLRSAFIQGYIKKATASDLREMPLESAKKNLIGYPVDFVLSNGFENIKTKHDLIIIAGMGPTSIVTILKENQDHQAKLVLQSNNKHYVLRKYLLENNYQIIDEWVIYDKFFYVIIIVQKGFMKLTDREIHLGPFLMNKKESQAYYLFMKNKLNKIQKKASNDKLKTQLDYYKSITK